MSERQNVPQDTRNSNLDQAHSKTYLDDSEEHNKQMKNLQDLQKELVQMKRKLNDASIRSHKLNIDVATMFNPETLASLETYKEQCNICLERMSQTLNEPLDDVIHGEEKPSPTEEANY